MPKQASHTTKHLSLLLFVFGVLVLFCLIIQPLNPVFADGNGDNRGGAVDTHEDIKASDTDNVSLLDDNKALVVDGTEALSSNTSKLSEKNGGALEGSEEVFGPDSDGDGLLDVSENIIGTNPNNSDTDGDGISDWNEYSYYNTDPLDYDTDDDGLSDSQDLIFGASPTDPDTDDDGLDDFGELQFGTSPTEPDTDWDGLSDIEELVLGTNPRSEDTDYDGLEDAVEVQIGTRADLPDTDGDGISDGVEVELGTDPLIGNSGIANLQGSYVALDQIELSWQFIEGTYRLWSDYHVERSGDGVNWTEVGVSQQGTFVDSVPNCETYHYRILEHLHGANIYYLGTPTGTTVVNCPPPNRNTQYSVFFDYLYCHDTTEIGSDEITLRVTLQGGFQRDFGLGNWDNGTGGNISVTPPHFSNPIRIELIETDSTSADDHLGTLFIDGSLAGQGLQGHHFTDSGADYNLSYRVFRVTL